MTYFITGTQGIQLVCSQSVVQSVPLRSREPLNLCIKLQTNPILKLAVASVSVTCSRLQIGIKKKKCCWIGCLAERQIL